MVARAAGTRRLISSVACALLAVVTAAGGFAQDVAARSDPPVVADRDRYRLVKRFDFDERKLGNFEDTPMHWRRLEGEGLPFFARGGFDEQVGHDAPPSLRLDIATGNVALEYDHYDLTIIPYADYFIEAEVRTEGLKHSRAFLAAYFVDRFGQRIPGSDRVSQLAGGAAASDWRRIELSLPGEFPDAYALRLQCWILHEYVWNAPAPDDVDPIVRQDTHGVAWFDDISIFRLPRARLRFSNPAAVVAPGAAEALLVEVNNATPHGLAAELTITDAAGAPVEQRTLHLTGVATLNHGGDSEPTESIVEWDDADDTSNTTARAVRAALPPLPAGYYVASLRLITDGEPLLTRRLGFAVLPRLPIAAPGALDLGVDLGRWRSSDIVGVERLLRNLAVGAAKIGIPMIGAVDSLEKSRYFTQISELVRRLAESRIDATAVMLSQAAALGERDAPAIRELIAQDSAWRGAFAPVLAQFGGVFTGWQLGDERLELRDARDWRPEEIEAVRALLGSFMTFPRLVVPRSLTAPQPAGQDVVSIHIDPQIPTSGMLHMLDFLTDPTPNDRWLQLDPPADPYMSRDARLAEFAQRLILCKALSPQRLYAPAPFEVADESGAPHWRPTDDYIPWRTLFTFLSGKTAAAILHPAEGVRAIAFDGAGGSCLFVWTETEPAYAQSVELYLGDDARLIDLWGDSVEITPAGGRGRFEIGPLPRIAYDLDTPTLLLEASFDVTPQFVQIHKREPRPVLRFRNPSDTRLTGEMTLVVPDEWTIEPTRDTFALEPGEGYERELRITLPPRQLARDYALEVELQLSAPETRTLHFPVDLRVGLEDIDVFAVAWFDGEDLVVEQTLRNLSDAAVSFAAFCEPPGRRRLDAAFQDIGPGQTVARTYVFPASRGLADAWLHYGVREIHGDRTLDLVVKAPH